MAVSTESAAEAVTQGGTNYATLAKSLTHDISETLSARSGRTRTLLITIAALFATFLTLALGIVTPLLIDKEVRAVVDEEMSELTFMRDLMTLELMMANLDPSSGEIAAELDEIASVVAFIDEEYLSEGLGATRRGRDFRAQIARRRDVLFGEFARRGDPGDLAVFATTLSTFTSFDTTDIREAGIALGREMLGAQDGAAAWMADGGALVAYLPVYTAAMDRAPRQNFPEIRLAFELVRLHMEDAEHPALPRLIAEIDDLGEQDIPGLRILFAEFLTESWRARPDAYSGRVRRNAEAFLADHGASHPIFAEIEGELASLR